MATKRLKVDLPGLMAAFEDASWETSYYLDLETGEVILLTDEELGYVDEPPDGRAVHMRQPSQAFLSEFSRSVVQRSRGLHTSVGVSK